MNKMVVFACILACSCGRSGEKVCEPGRQVECACAGGLSGVQICLSDGSGWGECECGCLRDCAGRECGPDPVCGESCGQCGDNEVCSEDGRCECGFLDCYGVCCGDGQVCHAGSCCTPDCAGRECGPDPFCGELCGQCPEKMSCGDEGSCVCTYQGCGDACCDEGQVCHSGSCCTPDCADRDCGLDPVCETSCGECVNECSGAVDPALCVEGVCQQVCCPANCELLGVNCGMWDDGCGGVIECGGCGPNEYCHPQTGECECMYTACEGVCCDYDEVCYAGYCCMPDCTGVQCGDDGCGGVCWQCGSCRTCNPDGECVGGCESGGAKSLMVTQGPVRTLYPGEEETLRVYLSGGAAGETISFEIVGYGFGSTLSAGSAVTSEESLAEVTLTGGYPGWQNRQFHVWAHHPEVPEGTYFYILLEPTVGALDGVGGKDESCYVEDSVRLKVRLLDANRETPIEGVEIAFYLVNPPSGGDASLQDSIVATDRLGLAGTEFHAGRLERQYQVVVEGARQDVGRVTFTVTVIPRQTCQADSDCLDGYICAGGNCRPGGLLPESCETSSDCPAGYFCIAHVCEPCPEESPDPNCQPGGACTVDGDCPPGFACRIGNCYPDNDPDAVVPDLGGIWRTSYYLDMSEPVAGMSTVDIVDALNRVANYCEITGIGFVDDLLCEMSPVYTADWVDVLIDIMANLPNILAELRAEGEMATGHLAPPELVSFSERWDAIHVRYLNACCYAGGSPTSCNPYEHPDFPECADIAIAVEELDAYHDVLQIDPFTGKVRVDAGGTHGGTLAVDARHVRMEYTRFVSFLVDRLVRMFVGYNDLEDALVHIRDCDLLQCLVDCQLGSWAPDVRQACENSKPSAGGLMRGLLDQIGVGWKDLGLTGWATVTAGGDPPSGENLGFSDFETGRDGYLDGSCTIVLSGDVHGAWYGER